MTAITKKENPGTVSVPTTIKGWLTSETLKQQIARALPKHCSPDRMLRVALTTFNRVPKLAGCTQESFLECMMNLSQWGLEPDGRRAHLIPYGNKCTVIIDYKGLVELAWRSGSVTSIHADVVCENDDFLYDQGEVHRHQYDLRKPRGKMYAVYAKVTLKGGATKYEVMGKDEVDAIKARSKSGSSGPWVTDYNEMAKKTVFRRLSKWLPLSADVMDAMYGDDDTVIEANHRPSKPLPAIMSDLTKPRIANKPPVSEDADIPFDAPGDADTQSTYQDDDEAMRLEAYEREMREANG